jgi:hypothetical protein
LDLEGDIKMGSKKTKKKKKEQKEKKGEGNNKYKFGSKIQ